MSIQLTLPRPNTNSIIAILDLLSTFPENSVYEQNRQRHETMTGNTVNVAKCVYYTHPLLSKYTQEVYQPFFEEPIIPLVIKLVNTRPGTPSFYLPHYDQKRITSLNFYLEPGGANVTTSFYNEQGHFDLSGNVCTYEDVTLKSRHSMNEQEWYLLDVNQYHSVENIETNRIAFALSFQHLNTVSFQEKYKHLVAKTGIEPVTHGFSIRCSTI